MSNSPFGHEHKHSNCFAKWYIGRKAKSLAGKYGFDDDASEVIFQDLILHLIKIWPQYDPGLSQPITFIHEVVDRKIRELIRLQKRMKRDYRLEVPLTEEAEDGLLDGVRGQPDVSDHELIEFREDCATILATLPEDLLEIAELLKELSPSDIARRLKISKSQVSRRMTKLRQHFVAEGYGDGSDSEETTDQENA
ncbi:MAG: sigma-70 family RNA polymerase sigma factor [Planctomycetota bacterium]|nr:MAG: sigma-70 family RNA polymerase sigma factor [Planctomycetota bacterium]